MQRQSTVPPALFDRSRIRRARARSAAHFHQHDFLHRRAMADIVDRLESVTRTFETALVYGAGRLVNLLSPECGVGRVISADSAAQRLQGCAPAFVYDEDRVPSPPQKFDLIVSLLTLHASNDLIGALCQYRAALKPDGLFIAALFGEETLGELKQALIAAELELAGGAHSRIPPFAALRDLGAALQRAGFALPVADIDRATVRYEDARRLIEDLRGMGETGGYRSGAEPVNRAVLSRALQLFAAAGGAARFDIIYLTGWAPHPDQPKPQKPGSAKHSLAEAIKRAGR